MGYRNRENHYIFELDEVLIRHPQGEQLARYVEPATRFHVVQYINTGEYATVHENQIIRSPRHFPNTAQAVQATSASGAGTAAGTPPALNKAIADNAAEPSVSY